MSEEHVKRLSDLSETQPGLVPLLEAIASIKMLSEKVDRLEADARQLRAAAEVDRHQIHELRVAIERATTHIELYAKMLAEGSPKRQSVPSMSTESGVITWAQVGTISTVLAAVLGGLAYLVKLLIDAAVK